MTDPTEHDGQYEVELKVQADHETVAEHLDEMGATCNRSVHQTDTYYKSPFEDLLSGDEALRVRRQWPLGEETDDEKDILIYKGPLMENDSETHEELEAVVTDSESMIAIFEKMGFEEATTIDRERKFYTVDGHTLSLDSVVGLGQFIELKMVVDDLESSREQALELLRDLGLEPEDQIKNTYIDVKLKDYL